MDKQLLRDCREYIRRGRWPDALETADAVLAFDKRNYHALVFRGLSFLRMENERDAENAYRAATDVDPTQLLAWQGLERLYRTQGKWDALAGALENMADIQRRADDAAASGTYLARLVELRRAHGSKAELADALALFLPSSRFYALLATLPVPNQSAPGGEPAFDAQMLVHTQSLALVHELIALCTALDTAAIDGDFVRQKSTIEGARHGLDALRARVTAAVLRRSRAPELYELVLSHPRASDDERRAAESRLLAHHELLAESTSASGPNADPLLKDGAVADARRTAEGMVALGVHDERAWRLVLEWRDATLAAQPLDELAAYAERFATPRARAARVLVAAVRTGGAELGTAAAAAAAEEAPDSHFCARVRAQLLVLDGDLAGARDALAAVHAPLARAERTVGAPLGAVRRELATLLGVVCTHLHAPALHREARAHLAAALADAPRDVYAAQAQLAHGELLGAAGEWRAAVAALDAAAYVPGGAEAALVVGDHALRAASERAWAVLHLGEAREARAAFERLLEREVPRAAAGVLWYRLGATLWELGDADAYRCFVTAVRTDERCAPAFTALGRFYLAAAPPDAVRAHKCFQKAFELDPREQFAGEHLVRQYAAQRQWGLVEVVARHVLGACGSDVHSVPWAHKAVGIVDTLHGRPEHAIAAFQTALRAYLRDVDAWTRLGEAYLASGRPVAALKAHVRALELEQAREPDARTWPIFYDIAAAQRVLGKHDAAIASLADVLRACPEQHSVRVILAETCLEHARGQLEGGYVVRAARLLHRALGAAHEALGHDRRLRSAWKAAGDAAAALAALPRGLNALVEVRPLLHALALIVAQEDTDVRVRAVDVVTAAALVHDAPECALDAPTALAFAALLFKHLAVLYVHERRGAAAAWTDLAVVLSRYDRALRYAAAHADAEQGAALAARAATARAQGTACIRAANALQPSARAHMVLGNLAFRDNAALAQHAYIRAIRAEPKSALPWTNLGMLYLHHGDYELAERAFLRAQTLDPAWPLCWLGRAIVLADQHTDARLSRSLFHHAASLSHGALLEADYAYALASLRMGAAAAASGALMPIAPLLALNMHIAHAPTPSALHLAALLAEQHGALHLASRRAEEVGTRLESEYEASESPAVALMYGVASVSLGRIRLARHDAAAAAEAFTTAQALLEDGGTALIAGQLACARAGAELGAAAAAFFTDGSRAELAEFLHSPILADLPPDTRASVQAHAAVLYAQMCWAQGPDTHAATSALDTALNAAPHSLPLLVTRIAAAACAGSPDEYAALVRTHFAALPPALQHALASSEQVTRLGILHRAAQGDTRGLVQYLAQVYGAPGRPISTLVTVAETLTRLAADSDVALELPAAADADAKPPPATPIAVAAHVLELVRGRARTHGEALWPRALRTLATAELFAGDPAARTHALHAVHLAPWDADAWKVLRSA